MIIAKLSHIALPRCSLSNLWPVFFFSLIFVIYMWPFLKGRGVLSHMGGVVIEEKGEKSSCNGNPYSSWRKDGCFEYSYFCLIILSLFHVSVVVFIFCPFYHIGRIYYIFILSLLPSLSSSIHPFCFPFNISFEYILKLAGEWVNILCFFSSLECFFHYS